MRWFRHRSLRWLLAATAFLLVAACGALVWLLWTEAGLARAVAMLESLETVEIRVTEAGGRLIGPLHAASVEIRHRRAVIRVEGLRLDYEPSGMLALRIAAEDIRAASVSIRLLPGTEPPEPPAFLPRWLTVAVENVAIDRFEIETATGTKLALTDVGGSATVTRSRVDFSGIHGDAGNWKVSGATGRLQAAQPLALAGEAEWSLLASREITGTARARGDLARLLVDAEFRQPARGHAALELRDLQAGMRWDGRLVMEEFDLRRYAESPPFGPLSAEFAVSGSSTHYAARGTVRGEGLPADGVAVNGAASFAEGRLTIPELTTRVADATIVRWRGFAVAADQPRFELHADWSGLTWPLTGRPRLRSSSGRLSAAGWRKLTFDVEGEFDPLVAPAFSGRAEGRLSGSELAIERSTWRALGGRIEASGTLARDPARAWTVAGQAVGLDPSSLRGGLDGSINFAFAASGSGVDADASWSATVRSLSGSMRGQLIAGSGGAQHAPGRTQFDDVSLSLGHARLTLNGSIGANAALDARLAVPDLSQVSPDLAGHVDAAFSLHRKRAALSFTGHDVAWREHRAVVFSVDARVDLADRETSWLRLRTSGLTLAGQTLTDTRLSLDGLVRDHSLALRVGHGDMAAELGGRGAWDGASFRLELARVEAEERGAPTWRLEAPSALEVSASEARLTPACFVYGPRRACLEGSWARGGAWQLRAQADAFPLEALDLRVPGSPRYRGLLAVDAQASGSAGRPWQSELRARIEDAALTYQATSGQPQTLALGRTLVTLQSAPEQHRLELTLADVEETELAAALVATRIEGEPLARLPIAGTITGSTQQLQLLPLLLPTIDRSSGRLALRVSVSGTVGAPQLTGTARLDDGSLDFYQTNLRLRDVEADLKLQDSDLALRASARAGEGRLAVEGDIGWRERQMTGTLALRGERLLLANVPEARVLASPDLRFTLGGSRIGVTGTVAIPEARIAPAETAGAVLPSVDERILRTDAGDEAGERFGVDSDVRLVLGDRVQLDAYGLSGRITGSVRAQSQPNETAVASGELEIADGRYRAYTRELEVERGRLLFTGGAVTDPGVDLRASRKLPGRVVGVIARGRLRRPQLTLYSEPPLPQTQIASLLIVGHSLDQLQDEDRGSLETGRGAFAAQGGALLASQLGRYAGLDDVGIAQDAADGQALVLGKFLSPRMYVSYGISLADEINTLKLRYTIGDRWVVSVESGRESAADIEYRIER